MLFTRVKVIVLKLSFDIKLHMLSTNLKIFLKSKTD